MKWGSKDCLLSLHLLLLPSLLHHSKMCLLLPLLQHALRRALAVQNTSRHLLALHIARLRLLQHIIRLTHLYKSQSLLLALLHPFHSLHLLHVADAALLKLLHLSSHLQLLQHVSDVLHKLLHLQESQSDAAHALIEHLESGGRLIHHQLHQLLLLFSMRLQSLQMTLTMMRTRLCVR